MSAFDTDCTNSSQGHRQCLKVFSILHGCFYSRRKFAFVCSTMHHTDRNFLCLMLCNIHGHNRINDMTFFCDTGCPFAHLIVRTSFICKGHVLKGFIRCCGHRKVGSLMSFLTADFFARRFTKTFRRGFLNPSLEGGLELFLEFLLSCSFRLSFDNKAASH